MTNTARTPHWYWDDASVDIESVKKFHLPGKHVQQRHAGGRLRNIASTQDKDTAFNAYSGPAALMIEGGDDGFAINGRIRSAKSTLSDRKVIRDLEALIFEQAPLTQTKTFWRGLGSGFEGAKEGDMVSDKAFVSTSRNSNLADSATSELIAPIKLKILAPAGTKVLDVQRYLVDNFERIKETLSKDSLWMDEFAAMVSEEQEFLFPTKSKFFINRISNDAQGIAHYDLRHLPK